MVRRKLELEAQKAFRFASIHVDGSYFKVSQTLIYSFSSNANIHPVAKKLTFFSINKVSVSVASVNLVYAVVKLKWFLIGKHVQAS